MYELLKTSRWLFISISIVFAGSEFAWAQETKCPDVLIADFEAETYGDWKAEGEAFGSGPVEGTLPGQMHVSGFQGKRLVNSFFNGDRTIGTLVQSFTVALPQGDDADWLAAYPIGHFRLGGKDITLAPVDAAARFPESNRAAFDQIMFGTSSDADRADDYQQPYRDQFHITTRRGWNNDPNGMVFHDGRYHLYFQHNPFGIGWGNMHRRIIHGLQRSHLYRSNVQ